MHFRFVVDVDVERIQGLFASRDELADEIQGALASADPGQISGSGGGEYEIQLWEVSEEIQKARRA